MSGVKGRSGPRKSPSTMVNEAMARVDKELPNIFNALINRALEGDREAQIYLIDRRLGKPKQTTELEGADKLGTAMIDRIYQVIEAKRREMTRPLELNYTPKDTIDVKEGITDV